jgi:lipopolysaccharide export LptBFGC system permease protein LptF
MILDGRIFYYDIFDIPRNTLHMVSVFGTTSAPFRLSSHMRAERIVWREGRWLATNGWEQNFPAADKATRESFERKVVQLPTPDTLAGQHNKQTDLMTTGELRQYIAKLSESGVSLAESQVMLYSRLAFPVVTLVMTMLAIPLGVTTGRRGAMYGIGLAIMLAAAYWLLTTIFAAIGQADLLPAWLAAWATNLLFLAAAGYMVMTVRT